MSFFFHPNQYVVNSEYFEVKNDLKFWYIYLMIIDYSLFR